jgi:DNA-binding MarR family transcriptional regulator
VASGKAGLLEDESGQLGCPTVPDPGNLVDYLTDVTRWRQDPMTVPDPARAGTAALLLAMGFRTLTDRFHELLREQGFEPLRPAHGFIFRLLSEHGELTATQLGAHLELTRQAATRLAVELEGWGYLARRPHPRDRRATVLALTVRGRDYVAHADALWARVEREWAALAGEEAVAGAKAAVAAWVAHAAEGGAPGLRPVW